MYIGLRKTILQKIISATCGSRIVERIDIRLKDRIAMIDNSCSCASTGKAVSMNGQEKNIPAENIASMNQAARELRGRDIGEEKAAGEKSGRQRGETEGNGSVSAGTSTDRMERCCAVHNLEEEEVFCCAHCRHWNSLQTIRASRLAADGQRGNLFAETELAACKARALLSGDCPPDIFPLILMPPTGSCLGADNFSFEPTREYESEFEKIVAECEKSDADYAATRKDTDIWLRQQGVR